MKRGYRLAALWGVSALSASVAIGCSTLDYGASEDELNLEEGRTKDNVLTDVELLGGAGTFVPTQQQIQKLLEKTPHGGGTRSVLADTKVNLGEDGGEVLVSEAIYNAAKVGGVNPLALLVRLQLEYSLVGTKAGQLSEADLKKRLDWAFGCGCPHAPICKTEPANYTGFYAQASCAVRLIKQHFDAARSRGKTSTGWGVGIAMSTQDQSEVTPENIATAVLYTYTPYAGQDFGGEKSTACKNAAGQADYCAGNALHTYLWDSYATAMGGRTAAAGDAGRDGTVPVIEDSGAVTFDTGVISPPDPPDPPDPPPVTGECQDDSYCTSNSRGHTCMSDNTCGCFSSTECPSGRVCDPSTSQCKAATTPPPTGTGTAPPPTGTGYPPPTGTGTPGLPRPQGDAGRYPLYDAGYSPTDTTNTTPNPTAPRPADTPENRPAAGVGPTQIGYSDNNPYGDNTSYTDGGKSKKKKNAAKDSGGCSVNAAGTPTELPSSSFFLAAGIAAILAGRRRRSGT